MWGGPDDDYHNNPELPEPTPEPADLGDLFTNTNKMPGDGTPGESERA